ncbi:M15 family metallopeptidase [Jeotgalibacillus soli]|uniref:Serine-type D-Ala-D-Ala carboxypeptidase n=1 Tax=Jeotgalibacillus soli TaxID=889306 RepID=A0A0C2RPH2_9BACL|nr:M15 family metallopeptidase [Jeotgalibacillus soli]KIL52170.1 serine-type D-Ala-D-Ala carboxypeptidase [Jeotgalibacillus soli]
MENQRLFLNKKKSRKGLWITLSIVLIIVAGGAVGALGFYNWSFNQAVHGVTSLVQNQFSGSGNDQDTVGIENREEEADQEVEEEAASADGSVTAEEGNSTHSSSLEPEELLTPETVTEPTYVQGVLIANKQYPLPIDYAPGVDPEANEAFERMQFAAREIGIELVAFSTFRSYEYQDELYHRYVEKHGQEEADRFSSKPGYSEHQTGLGFDIGEEGQEQYWAEDSFKDTEAAKWLAEDAHHYGFILRYPPGKEEITGYQYESWHFRYLGVELATKVHASGLTLEEYLGI